MPMRTKRKISKMLHSLFNIFSVTKLTIEELDSHLQTFKHIEKDDPEEYKLLLRQVNIAKGFVKWQEDHAKLVAKRVIEEVVDK